MYSKVVTRFDNMETYLCGLFMYIGVRKILLLDL